MLPLDRPGMAAGVLGVTQRCPQITAHVPRSSPDSFGTTLPRRLPLAMSASLGSLAFLNCFALLVIL
jgi:hypothetical protein